MRGVDATLEVLKRNGVDAIFGIPGGPLIPLFDALFDDSDIRLFLTRHEQGAGHMAEGYAKASGNIAVCTGTSGPGATNLVTPIADAYMDSVPMLALTGQVGSTRVGTDAFQEADIVGITLPVVKHSWLVKDAHELPTVLEEAIHVATTGRPGPVLVDVCVDQWAVEVDDYSGPRPPHMPGYAPPGGSGHPRQLQAAARAIAESKKPMLYAGGGIIASNAADELTRMAEVAQIPVTTTLMGLGGFPASNDLYVGMPGMHGIAASTFAMDPAEIGKNRAAHIGIAGEAKAVLAALADTYVQQEARHDDASRSEWLRRIHAWLAEYPYTVDDDEPGVIAPQSVIQSVYDITGGDAIVATEVGQHQMWAAQFYPFEQPRKWITSGGLGTMGFGLPAALGAQVAFPDQLVVDIAGDGSFEMTLQELSTAQTYGLPVKIVILNNGFLGMVRQWQELFWDKRYSNTSFGEFQPDFAALAGAYGIPGMRIEDPDELDDALRETLSTDGPALIDIQVNRDSKVFPMVPQGKGPDAMLVTDPTK